MDLSFCDSSFCVCPLFVYAQEKLFIILVLLSGVCSTDLASITMVDLSDVDDKCSRAWRQSIYDISEWGYSTLNQSKCRGPNI